MNPVEFHQRMSRYRKLVGCSQESLARHVGLHPSVLSRKLRGKTDAYLTVPEIKKIILLLAGRGAFSGQHQIVDLLELMDLGFGVFREEEWSSPPLRGLGESPSSSLAGPRGSSPTDGLVVLTAFEPQLIGMLLLHTDVRVVTIRGAVTGCGALVAADLGDGAGLPGGVVCARTHPRDGVTVAAAIARALGVHVSGADRTVVGVVGSLLRVRPATAFVVTGSAHGACPPPMAGDHRGVGAVIDRPLVELVRMSHSHRFVVVPPADERASSPSYGELPACACR